jgi:uncharacterized membrane protein YjjP (DUF1212 family)
MRPVWRSAWNSRHAPAHVPPAGLLVSLGSDEAAGFEAVGAPLRFDQTAGVTASVRRVLRAELGPDDAVAELLAVLAAPPRIPRRAAPAGLLPVGAGLALILQPAWENVLAALVRSLVVAAPVELAARSPLVSTLLPVLAALTAGCLIFLAADAGLIEGPLRTPLAPIAVLLPGAVGVIVAVALGVLFGSAVGRALPPPRS